MVDIIHRHPQQSLSVPSFTRSPLQTLLRDLVGWDPLQDLAPAFRSQESFVPPFEVHEKKEGYVIKADLPGVREEDIKIAVSGNRITISGKREHEEHEESTTYYCSETAYGAFSRSFTLPDAVDVDNCKAEMKNGQLLITVPKRAELQTRQITVGQQKGDNKQQQKGPPRAQA